ncbi:MAG: M23 family metallopeptidase [Alphaproteobacteria bacterium]|nr:M23 family metallopeptidase [Alphaproteobacteria bacterium]
MNLKSRTFVVFVLTATLSGCVAVPLNNPNGYQQVRAINSRNTKVHDRSQYRLQSISPAFVTVYKGDTVYSLSRKYTVPTRALIETNNLKAPFLLSPGQRLKLPPASVHVVQKGDTIYSISRRYNVDMSLLARQNQLKAPYNIYEGQFLKLPGSIVEYKGTQVSSLKTPEKPSAKAQQPKKTAAKQTKTTKKDSVRLPPPPVRSKAKFAWPVDGKVMTKFGSAGAGRHNDGINIKVNEGVSVRAAENGVVAYAGNELKGFGNLLLVKHADGWITAYAHNASLLVKRGETVTRGQSIAKAGKTGNAKEPQLHFEIRKGTKAVDPLAYMEKR